VQQSDETRSRAWQAALACAIGTALGSGALLATAFPLFTKALTAEFGWGRATMAGAFAISVLIVPFVLPLSGRLIDRYGVRKVVLPATFLYAITTGAFALANGSPTQFAILSVLNGLAGFAASGPAYLRTILAWVPRRRGIAFGALAAAAGLSGAAIAPLVQLMIQTIGWRAAYLAIGAAILIISLPVQWLFLHAPARTQPDQKASNEPGMSLSAALRTSAFWLAIVALMFNGTAIMGFRQQSVLLLGDRGLSAAFAASVLSVLALASIGGQLAAGALLDRIHNPKITLPFFACPLAGLLLVIQGPPTPLTVMVGAALIGFGSGAENNISPYFTSRYFGLKSFAEIQGWKVAAFMFVTGPAPLLMGLWFDRFGSYTGLFVILEVILALCLVLIALLPRYAYDSQLQRAADAAPSVSEKPATA